MAICGIDEVEVINVEYDTRKGASGLPGALELRFRSGQKGTRTCQPGQAIDRCKFTKFHFINSQACEILEHGNLILTYYSRRRVINT